MGLCQTVAPPRCYSRPTDDDPVAQDLAGDIDGQVVAAKVDSPRTHGHGNIGPVIDDRERVGGRGRRRRPLLRRPPARASERPLLPVLTASAPPSRRGVDFRVGPNASDSGIGGHGDGRARSGTGIPHTCGN